MGWGWEWGLGGEGVRHTRGQFNKSSTRRKILFGAKEAHRRRVGGGTNGNITKIADISPQPISYHI